MWSPCSCPASRSMGERAREGEKRPRSRKRRWCRRPSETRDKKRCLFPSFSTIPFHSALLTLIAAFFTKWFLRIHFRSGEARSCAAVRLFAERYAANASLVGANSVVLSFGSESFSVRFAALTAASSVDSAGVAAATEAMEDSAEYFIF